MALPTVTVIENIENNYIDNYIVKILYDPNEINIDFINRILKYQDIKNLFPITKTEIEENHGIENWMNNYNLLFEKLNNEKNDPKLKNKTTDTRKIDPKIKKANLKKKKDPNEITIDFEDPNIELNNIDNIYVITDCIEDENSINSLFKTKNKINLTIKLTYYKVKDENSLEEINKQIKENNKEEYFNTVYDKNFEENLQNRLENFLNDNKTAIKDYTKTFIDKDFGKYKDDNSKLIEVIKNLNKDLISCKIEINFNDDPNLYAQNLITQIYEQVSFYKDKLKKYNNILNKLSITKISKNVKKMTKLNSYKKFGTKNTDFGDNKYNLLTKTTYNSILNESFVMSYNLILFAILEEIKNNDTIKNEKITIDDNIFIDKLNLLTDKLFNNPLTNFSKEYSSIFNNIQDVNNDGINFINESNTNQIKHYYNTNYKNLKNIFNNKSNKLNKPIPEEDIKKIRNNIYYGLLDNELRDNYINFKTLENFKELINNSQNYKNFDFSENKLVEYIDSSTIYELLNEFLIKENENIVSYDEIENCFFLINYYICPPGRILYKKWVNNDNIVPDFQNYINNKKDLDENKKYYMLNNILEKNQIKEERKIIYPNDRSIIDLKRIYVGNKTINRINVTKGTYNFGLNEKNFWVKPNDNIRINLSLKKKKLIQSINYKNILLIENTEDGDLFQKYISKHKSEELKIDIKVINLDSINDENGRLYCGNGNLIKFYKNKNYEIMYSNGILEIYKKDSDFIKKVYYDGNVEIVNKLTNEVKNEKIECEFLIDYESNSKIYILNNFNKFIIYDDGNTLFIHKDGTKIFNNKIDNEFLLEAKNYASVKIKYDKFRMRNPIIIGQGNSYANLGKDDLFERTSNGRILECYIDNENILKLYKEKREIKFQKYEDIFINYFEYDNDFVLKSESTGDCVLLSKKEHNKEDWYINLFLDKRERNNGVYTLNLTNMYFYSTDNQNNIFNVNFRGEDKNYISISLNFDLQNKKNYKYNFVDFPDDITTFIPDDCKYLPCPQDWIEPNLLKIYYKGKAEIYKKSSILDYYKNKSKYKIINCLDSYKENIDKSSNTKPKNDKIITIIKNLVNYDKYKLIKIINKEIPGFIRNLKITKFQSNVPDQKNLIYRNFKLIDFNYNNFKENILKTNALYEDFLLKNEKIDKENLVEERDEFEIELENSIKRDLQDENISKKLIISID